MTECPKCGEPMKYILRPRPGPAGPAPFIYCDCEDEKDPDAKIHVYEVKGELR